MKEHDPSHKLSERLTREMELARARERLHHMHELYVQAEAELHELEQGAFRVVIFGSARIQPDDDLYQSIYRIARALAAQGIDIVTGGGPGLMEAANRGVLDVVERESQSYGVPIDLPAILEPINKHLDIKSMHYRFSSRLDEFMRLSNAIIVAPGGIGTLLELVYVWQLLQVGLTNDRPVILFGKRAWGGLLFWMRNSLLAHGYISKEDFRWITLADDEEEIIHLITLAHLRFLQMMEPPPVAEAEADRSVTEEVVASAPPTELTEEGTT